MTAETTLPQDGDFVPFKGFHPFYLDMSLKDVFALFPSWNVSKVHQDENDFDDEFLIIILRKGEFQIALSIDKRLACEQNELAVHSIERSISSDRPQMHLTTAQAFAERYEFSIRRDTVAKSDDEGCNPYLIYYESDGNPSLSLFEDDGCLKSIALTRDFDFEIDR